MSGAVCMMEEQPRVRRRLRCPVHKKMHYGWLHTHYDTRRMFFDCGTMLDFGYGYYRGPRKQRARA